MSEIFYSSATEIAELIRDKQVSPTEALDAHIARIEAVNPRLNAIVTLSLDQARDAALRSEAKIAKGEPLRPLEGVPVSIKDTIETAGIRTVSGTRLHEFHVPTVDAPVVARLKQAGAVILGKTNVPEIAMDLRSENPVFGRTSNPWNLTRVPGGSSGGEAASIASGCSAAGVGSDMGGSIRIPAHFCGIAGLKPTPGRIPCSGHWPNAATGPFALGTSCGPMARRVEDLTLLFKVLIGFDAADPMSVNLPWRDPSPTTRVMFYTNDGISPVTAETRDAVEHAARALADAGAEVVERRPAKIERSHDLWSRFLAEPGWPGTASLYKGREDSMGPLLKAMSKMPHNMDMERYLSAWTSRDKLRASVIAELMEYPIMLAPVASIPAFAHGHRGNFDVDGEPAGYLEAFSYVQAYNLLGLPVTVVRAGTSPEGLPIGVQVIGRPWDEERTLAAAATIEAAMGAYLRPVGI
jgi:Asp-tRNA(Asn)/Glu-tRNA(Gln) amidotransferase A subunit family amidase